MPTEETPARVCEVCHEPILDAEAVPARRLIEPEYKPPHPHLAMRAHGDVRYFHVGCWERRSDRWARV
jgi:hypothetical protein